MIPLFKVYMNQHAGQAAKQVINSGYIGQGEVVSQFEKKLQAWFVNPHIVTLNSGTSGLHLALHMLKHGGGGKVLASPLTCTATNWPILANGYDIEWVDVDPKTLNMDLDDLARKITKETKIILLLLFLSPLPLLEHRILWPVFHSPVKHAQSQIYPRQILYKKKN